MEKTELQKLPEYYGILGWEDVAPLFAVSWVSGVPCVFVGDPGSSKSTFQIRFARSLGLKVEILDLQYLTQTRLLGIPNPDKLKQGVLNYVGGVIAHKPDVVILEELTRCFDHVQGLILEFLREGRIDNQYLKCKRIANCNPPQNDLIGIHYLDYAAATRLVHISIPNISNELMKTFINNWNREWEPDSKGIALAQKLDTLTIQSPPTDQFKEIANSIMTVLAEYRLSGRQLDTLMRLLSASWNIEQTGLHTFSALDLGRMAASTIPLQLTKNRWNIDPEMLAIQVSRHLSDFPWSQRFEKKTQVASMKVEEAKQKFNTLSIKELSEISLKSDLDGFIAFETMLHKISTSAEFRIPFDNFEELLAK